MEITLPAPPALAARHFVAKLAFETDPADLAAELAAGTATVIPVDTRLPEGFAAGHLPGAINLPHASIDEVTTAALDRSAVYVAYCWGPACNASTKGAAKLAGLGFTVKELIGGISAWEAEGFEVHGSATSPVACAC
jgi:rhodanese-related sulfurtransferase